CCNGIAPTGPLASAGTPGLCFGRQGRSLTTRWINDERCLLAGPSCAFTPMSRRIHADGRVRRYEFLFVVCSLARDRGFFLSELFFRKVQFVAEVGGPLHGSADTVVAGVCSLQVRVAPRCLRGRETFGWSCLDGRRWSRSFRCGGLCRPGLACNRSRHECECRGKNRD